MIRPFDYLQTHSIAGAATALAENGPDAVVLAGGTDLLIEWRRPEKRSPKMVVDISSIPELKGIEEDADSVTIHALATHTEVRLSQIIGRYAPLLTVAVSGIGSPQIRNRGTVGGNIMNAAACADTVPPLVALGATVTLQSSKGTRTIGLADFFVKPYKTRAAQGEILTHVRFPKLPVQARSCFIKLGRRNALAISRLSVAAIVATDASGTMTDARIVPGAALPTWRRVTEAEQMLLGKSPSIGLFAAAGAKVSEVMIGDTGRRWSTEYKEPVIAVLVRRALEQCCETIPLTNEQ